MIVFIDSLFIYLFMPSDPEKFYSDGYAALDRGDYSTAIELAGKCIDASGAEAYWYAGALGLRCWAANYAGDHDSVVRDANALLSFDTGDDKMWFDGLALFNLALIRRRIGDAEKAELLFDQARAKFAAYRIHPDYPEDWRLIRELFEAISRWSACGEFDRIDNLAGRLSVMTDHSTEFDNLHIAADLYQRYARGEDVSDKAVEAANNGVSRSFLALIMI